MTDENIKKENDNKYKYRDRKDYNKQYFLVNKQKLLEQIICPDCEGTYQKYNKASHIKTKKHKAGLEMQKLKKDINVLKNVFVELNKKMDNM
jgi:hypothetical protein